MVNMRDKIKETKELLKNRFSHYFIFFNDNKLEEELDKRIESFNEKIGKHIEQYSPFDNDYRLYRKSYSDFKYNDTTEKSVKDDINHYKNFDENANIEFFNEKLKRFSEKYNILERYKQKNNKIFNKKSEEKIKKLNESFELKKETDIKSIRKNILDNWKQSLDKKYIEWVLKEIDRFRADFFKEIEEFLENLKKIKELQEVFGYDTGLLFNLSLSNILKRDLEYIKILANFIRDTKSIKELCDMLGRFVKSEESYKIEKIFRKETFHTKVIDVNSKEEIVGITYSRDINNILPQEKLLLSEGVLETLFGIKYFENRLLTFKKEGYTDYSDEKTKEEYVKVIEEEKKGPIIICVDTSGSMSGIPETIAKAITLYLATRAMKQKRNCYLINFSTQLYTTDLTYPKTIDNLIEFLRISFNGGTDAIPALRHAIKTMNNDNYKKSDLLFISDFVFNGFTEDDYYLVKNQKENKNKFYSLIIGSTPMFSLKESFFDYNWVYDANTSSVKEITGKICDNILK